MIRYLTGATGAAVEAALGLGGSCPRGDVGLLVQPGNQYYHRVSAFPFWAADNGAFSRVGAFCPVKFRRMLARENLRAHAASCLFVAAPDVLTVNPDGSVYGDAVATLAQFPQWATEIRAAGYPVALVAQDGLDELLGQVPWHLVDYLFVGGSTEWKLGDRARKCVRFAAELGIQSHMGRVNSYRRLRLAADMGCASADGTFLRFAPTENVPRLQHWYAKLGAAHA